MTIFTYNLPFPFVLRLWDIFLFEGIASKGLVKEAANSLISPSPSFPSSFSHAPPPIPTGFESTFAFAIAIFKLVEDKVLAKPLEDLLKFLKFESESDDDPFRKLDPEKLIQTYKHYVKQGILHKARLFTEEYDATFHEA